MSRILIEHTRDGRITVYSEDKVEVKFVENPLSDGEHSNETYEKMSEAIALSLTPYWSKLWKTAPARYDFWPQNIDLGDWADRLMQSHWVHSVYDGIEQAAESHKTAQWIFPRVIGSPCFVCTGTVQSKILRGWGLSAIGRPYPGAAVAPLAEYLLDKELRVIVLGDSEAEAVTYAGRLSETIHRPVSCAVAPRELNMLKWLQVDGMTKEDFFSHLRYISLHEHSSP